MSGAKQSGSTNPLPEGWVSLAHAFGWLTDRLMLTNPEFVINHWDCKYIDARIDMRTGNVRLTAGNKRPTLSEEGAISVSNELEILRQFAHDCRSPREMRAVERIQEWITANQSKTGEEDVQEGSEPAGPPVAQIASAPADVDDGCICEGNWRAIVKESDPLLDQIFINHQGERHRFFGIVWTKDDFYYGMSRIGGTPQTILLSCVGSIKGHGYLEAPNPQVADLEPSNHD